MFSGGVREYIYGRESRDFGDLGRRLGAVLRRNSTQENAVALLPARNASRHSAGRFRILGQLTGNTIYISNHGALLRGATCRCSSRLRISVDDRSQSVAETSGGTDLFDLPARQGIRTAFQWRGEPSTSGARLRPRIVAGLARTIAQQAAALPDSRRRSAQTLGGVLPDDLGIESEVLVIDGIVLVDFDYIDLGKIRCRRHTVPVTSNRWYSRHPQGQAPPHHHLGRPRPSPSRSWESRARSHDRGPHFPADENKDHSDDERCNRFAGIGQQVRAEKESPYTIWVRGEGWISSAPLYRQPAHGTTSKRGSRAPRVYINHEASRTSNDCYCLRNPGGGSSPAASVFEEMIYVLDGRGSTPLNDAGQRSPSNGTRIAVRDSDNCWHQHFNGQAWRGAIRRGHHDRDSQCLDDVNFVSYAVRLQSRLPAIPTILPTRANRRVCCSRRISSRTHQSAADQRQGAGRRSGHIRFNMAKGFDEQHISQFR